MAKNYILQFGGTFITNLSPTFTVFNTVGGSIITSPGINQVPTSTGLYYFSYNPTMTIAFIIDAGASLAAPARYLAGSLDPIQAVDEKIGTVDSSIGSTVTDPTTLFGYLKRNQEFEEGDSTFTKSSGTWDVYARGATQLAQKVITDSGSVITKT